MHHSKIHLINLLEISFISFTGQATNQISKVKINASATTVGWKVFLLLIFSSFWRSGWKDGVGPMWVWYNARTEGLQLVVLLLLVGMGIRLLYQSVRGATWMVLELGAWQQQRCVSLLVTFTFFNFHDCTQQCCVLFCFGSYCLKFALLISQ